MFATWQRVLVLASAALSGLGCTHEPTGPSSQTPALPAFGDSLFGKGATLWFVADSLGAGRARPTVDPDRVYFARGESAPTNEITARDRVTGALRWHQQFSTGKNVVLAGNVVAGATGVLGLFDRQTGAPGPRYAPSDDDPIASNIASRRPSRTSRQLPSCQIRGWSRSSIA